MIGVDEGMMETVSAFVGASSSRNEASRTFDLKKLVGVLFRPTLVMCQFKKQGEIYGCEVLLVAFIYQEIC